MKTEVIKNNMADKSIINWDNVFDQSSTFKKNTPCKFAFVENFIEKSFYQNCMIHIRKLMKLGLMVLI